MKFRDHLHTKTFEDKIDDLEVVLLQKRVEVRELMELIIDLRGRLDKFKRAIEKSAMINEMRNNDGEETHL